ncbi:MAG: hypothetical protein ACI9T9_002638 [Oleiphilaceae bacterium]|jgi:hypothetical protein
MAFIQTYLSAAVLAFVEAISRRLVIFCIQVTVYLLDHQFMIIRHIPVPNPSDSIRCANGLSCRFVDAR